jgi:predicted nuclease with TOPRIM domain
MSYYSGQQAAADHERELSSIPRDLDLYAHVEGLVGEENELMEEAEEGHKEEKRERLHAIRTELDRAWETLRQRAERHGKPVS